MPVPSRSTSAQAVPPQALRGQAAAMRRAATEPPEADDADLTDHVTGRVPMVK